jgi:hypothetical protein
MNQDEKHYRILKIKSFFLAVLVCILICIAIPLLYRVLEWLCPLYWNHIVLGK